LLGNEKYIVGYRMKGRIKEMWSSNERWGVEEGGILGKSWEENTNKLRCLNGLVVFSISGKRRDIWK
jgi:hypothetical protein